MTAPAPSPIQTAEPADPVLRAALTDIMQFGVTVGRALAKLASVEEAAADAMTEAAIAAAREVVARPGDPEEARVAAQRLDLSEMSRDSAAARMASIAASYDSTARAVRRTVALIRRLDDPRPFPVWTVTERRASRPGAAPTSPPDTPPERLDRTHSDLAEEMDQPERFPDETGGRPTAEVLTLIGRALGLIKPDKAPDPAAENAAEQRRAEREAEREALKAYAFDSPERQARVDEIADRLAWRAPRTGHVPDT